MSEATKEIAKQSELSESGVDRRPAARTYIPRVDVIENNDLVVLLADMPGVEQADVDVTLEKNILTISGQVEERRPEGYNSAHVEYRVGSFERTFALSDDVDRDRIEASMKNGVLRLEIPKAEAVRSRKIEIQAAS